MAMSRDWQYAYVDGKVPTFTADADGEYDLQLKATLAFPDRAYPDVKTSTSELKLKVGEGAAAAGCAAAPLGGPAAAIAPGAAGHDSPS